MSEEDKDKQGGSRSRRRKRSRGVGDQQGGGTAGPEGDRPSGSTVLLKGPASLERLRSRVEGAALEIERLRKENTALVDRLKALEVQPPTHALGNFTSLESDPEVLRRKISGFIEAIDRYLEKEQSPDQN